GRGGGWMVAVRVGVGVGDGRGVALGVGVRVGDGVGAGVGKPPPPGPPGGGTPMDPAAKAERPPPVAWTIKHNMRNKARRAWSRRERRGLEDGRSRSMAFLLLTEDKRDGRAVPERREAIATAVPRRG